MTPIEEYLCWLDEIAGSNGKIYDIGGQGVSPQLIAVTFSDIPERGYSTTYSFGLSSVNMPQWVNSRPELVISVNSSDSSWGLAMGELIRQERGKSLFEYGSMFDFKERISDESQMTAFVVFANALYERGDESARLSDRKIGLSQLYPIYTEEMATIRRMGIERFFRTPGADFFDVRRSRIET